MSTQLSLFEISPEAITAQYIRPAYATCLNMYKGQTCKGQCPQCSIMDGYHPPSVNMVLNTDSWLCHSWPRLLESFWNENVYYLQDKDGFTIRQSTNIP